MSDTQLIKDKIDIVDFINEYVQLKPAGVNQKGLCPFHHEKTPSFMVNRERQSWHCFGCSKGGDIFSFAQEVEGMEFVEALRFLAERAGVPLTFRAEHAGESSQKTRIKEINAAAANFFHNFFLRMEQSKGARNYLDARGITGETIVEWQIGFVPDQWDLLTRYLLKKGYGIDDLVAAGLTIAKHGVDGQPSTPDVRQGGAAHGFYDRFRGRIMFPIWDAHGYIVGFTGRVLVETERSGGKYINTPQTVVYDKSRVVFGLNKAKSEIKMKNLIVMVEGQMDVIACHQAGMKNVVATSGTALTEYQVKLLKRYSNNINIAFDADAAGQQAAKRGIDVALSEGMSVKVIQIPEGKGKDPDECLRLDKAVWLQAVLDAVGIMDWYMRRAFSGKDMADPRQKQMIADTVLTEIARIPYAVEQDHWLRELAARLGVEASVLRDDLVRFRRKEAARNRPPVAPLGGPVAGQADNTAPAGAAIAQRRRLDLLMESLFTVFIYSPNQFSLAAFSPLGECLSTGLYRELYNALQGQYNKMGSLDINQLRESLQQDNQENIIDVLLMKGEVNFSIFSEVEVKKEVESLVSQIKDEWVRERRKKLQKEIEGAEAAGDKERTGELLRAFEELKN